MNVGKQLISACSIALISMSFAGEVSAATARGIGVPVRAMANSTYSKWIDSFDLNGVTPQSLGVNCPADSNGFIGLSIAMPGTASTVDPTGDRLWSLVLAAEVAGKPITVSIDDTKKDVNGNCLAIWAWM